MTTYRKNKLVKPFLKWAGGKRQLLPEIEQHMPTLSSNSQYFEPFVGGGAVFLNLQRPHTVINDFNSELINTYKVVRDHLSELIQQLQIHEQNNSSDYYYQIRDWDRTSLISSKSNIERAGRFIYLNKTGFNGLFRVNHQNQINVPYGRYKHPAIVNKEILTAVSRYLSETNVDILNMDFEKSISKAKTGDFVYFDPPYAPLMKDKQSFVGYTLDGFGEAEQIRLYKTFDKLTEQGVKAMLSNSSVDFIHDLYSKYAATTKVVQATRAINSKASGRGKVDEVLIMNYDSTGRVQ